MDKLEVKSIKLHSDGSLIIETNISDNLELAKHINKKKMEQILNPQPLEMHVYQDNLRISSMVYLGDVVPFTFAELSEFMEEKHRKTYLEEE